MSDDGIVQRGLENLLTMANRCEVFGFEYEHKNVARVVWRFNAALVKRLMPPEPGPEASGASIWSAANADETSFYVLVVDDNLGLREKGTWGGGVPAEMDEEWRLSLIERHLSQLLNNLDPSGLRSTFEGHYGLGAELRRGGSMRLRIGGE